MAEDLVDTVEDTEYEAAFAAQVAKNEAARAGEVATPEPEPTPTAAPAAVKEAPDAAPAPAPAAVPQAPAPAAAPAALSDEDNALLGSVPEAQRAALKSRLEASAAAQTRAAKLEQDNRSMAGRVSAYQRRYEEATGKRPVVPAPQITAEQKSEWASFAKEYPEIGAAIEARFAADTGRLPAAQGQELVAYVQEQKRQEFLRDAFAAVDTVHPGWRELGANEQFRTWKASSPTYEKLAASDEIADAIALFDLYEAHRGKQPKPVVDTAAADQIAARRAKQAEGALTPDGKQATPNNQLDLNDADQLFAFYAQKANSRIRGR